MDGWEPCVTAVYRNSFSVLVRTPAPWGNSLHSPPLSLCLQPPSFFRLLPPWLPLFLARYFCFSFLFFLSSSPLSFSMTIFLNVLAAQAFWRCLLFPFPCSQSSSTASSSSSSAWVLTPLHLLSPPTDMALSFKPQPGERQGPLSP